MYDLLNFILQKIVQNSDSVSIEQIDEPGAITFNVQIHPDDIASVIGKQGRTARAMRTILGAASTKLGKRSVLEILE